MGKILCEIKFNALNFLLYFLSDFGPTKHEFRHNIENFHDAKSFSLQEIYGLPLELESLCFCTRTEIMKCHVYRLNSFNKQTFYLMFWLSMNQTTVLPANSDSDVMFGL